MAWADPAQKVRFGIVGQQKGRPVWFRRAEGRYNENLLSPLSASYTISPEDLKGSRQWQVYLYNLERWPMDIRLNVITKCSTH